MPGEAAARAEYRGSPESAVHHLKQARHTAAKNSSLVRRALAQSKASPPVRLVRAATQAAQVGMLEPLEWLALAPWAYPAWTS